MLINTYGVKDDGKLEKHFLELMKAQNEFVSGESIWPLPNLTPSTEIDFWWHRSTYSFQAEAHILQFRAGDPDPGERFPKWSNALVYLVDHSNLQGGGFVVLFTYNRMDYNHPRKSKNPELPAVEYFTWVNCVHDFKSKNIGNCLNRYTCTKCGVYHDIDSSG